jgi:glycosyltransferase involved in cell wall biosynthesis
MRIGIDISQIVYEGTGVGKYVREMVRSLTSGDTTNEYVLFGASLRMKDVFQAFYHSLENKKHVSLRVVSIPPTLLALLWNKFHIVPVEWFIGQVDVFWSSDWTQPPLKNAKGITTIHDLIALKFPYESHSTVEFDPTRMRISPNIVATHTRRLQWVKKECAMILCDSEATKKDCIELLGIENERLSVVYPGYSVYEQI